MTARPGPAALAARVLEEIVAGTVGTGQDFFDALVVCLTKALGVRYAVLGEVIPPERSAVRTLAFCADGKLGPAARYDLAGTPCANVLSSGVCFYPKNVIALFPDDALLKEMGADSYLSVPLRAASGEALGLLVVLHSRAIDTSIDTSIDPATIL
jgi:hypothetical protein